MKLTVSLITYNHAPFIAQAIESALDQRTDFDFEILIGEDDSTDGTREIVRDYAARYPDRIRVFYHSRADNIAIGGRATGRRNLINNLQSVRGEYIAMLDGDDYWTDRLKLQKQVDYLDANHDCSMCCHKALLVNERGAELSRVNVLRVLRAKYNLEDLLRGDFYPWTCTVVFRREAHHLPDWYETVPVGDFPLHALHAERGDIGFIDEFMAAYRQHSGGMWTGGETPEEWLSRVDPKRTVATLGVYEALLAHFGKRFRDLLRARISNAAYDLVWHYRCQRDWSNMRAALRTALRAQPRNPQVKPLFVLKSLVLAHMPFLDRILSKSKALQR